MSIVIAAIENHRDSEIDSLCRKYLQRLTGPWKTELLLLPAARVKEPEKQQETESQTLLKHIKPGDVLLLCDERGQTFSSTEFSAFFEKELSALRGRIVIGIGGSYGFTPAILKQHRSIRLSNLTFPHHLARLMLAEQLYRASCIAKNTGYHHA